MPAGTDVRVTVRYFAAARAAAGAESETIDVPSGTTVDALVATLRSRDDGLASVLARCSYLRDGVAVRDMGVVLDDAQTIDVLPPFAGG
ncbi:MULTISPECIES: MoaD/ThiS family protein [Mycolicibacterium]|uniref:Molybdopterin synthase sulfur carrier subunit n=1 Tax=Mycolicibacterium gilvum (strain DSM 45189 / LMG 24558 / Spyr1) TaxID=278137 RepID=E6TFY1_MYCSR|nr:MULTISPECIES: MoaD/ThiS family protein [Mycolicibacterium]ADT97774.1 molybdopterin converting factor, small subunit [Mycolicibacterium gilvum Spyr1]MBV5246563.1 MoaD/ThiS family protein [Mycolicibacterium sp. PAM1]MCV7057644.1 MoaD/ThiS family protein [Mycolicibacterium gilvum]